MVFFVNESFSLTAGCGRAGPEAVEVVVFPAAGLVAALLEGSFRSDRGIRVLLSAKFCGRLDESKVLEGFGGKGCSIGI